MLTPRLFHARSNLQMVIVARHDHHAHRVGAATLSDRQQQGSIDGSWIRTSRAHEVLQIGRMEGRPHASRAEQDHVAFNQWHSRRMTCGSAGRATSGARRVPPELPCGAYFPTRSGGARGSSAEDHLSHKRINVAPGEPLQVRSGLLGREHFSVSPT